MSPSIRWVVPLCLTSSLWAFSFGLSAPLCSLWLQDAGVHDSLIGLNTGLYYLGIVVAAGLVPLGLRRWGNACLIVGLVASALSIVLFPWAATLACWFTLRVINGVATALTLVPLETYINRQSSAQRRAQNFGCYAFCIALGMALGTFLGMELYVLLPRTAFAIGACTPLLGTAVALAWRPAFPSPPAERSTRTPLALGRNFLSFGSAWSQGFLEGGMIGLLPLYLISVGIVGWTASCLMSGLMIGVILAQIPVAWLADRLGRARILVACNIATLLGLAGLLWPAGTVWLALCLFIVGACSGAFYPLGLSLLGDRMPAVGLARATSVYLAINSLGSVAGPAIAGRVMDVFGRGTLFLTGAIAAGLVFTLWMGLALRSRLAGSETVDRPSPPNEESPRIAA